MTGGEAESTTGLVALGSQTIVGASPRLREAVERAWGAAASGAAGVLLVGEPGTGKELLARGIHYASTPYEAFLPFRSAAVPTPLLAAELFGTHPTLRADSPPPRRGALELVGGGTLVVADVTRIPLPLQRRLAAALTEGRITREGGDAPVRVGCRVIVSCSAPPEGPVAAGTMDPALHDALAPARIDLPPLRDRRGDVRLLAEHFLSGAGEERGVALRLDAEALAALEAHPWPGNVRELRHVVERAALLAGGAAVRAEHLIVLHRTARSGLSNVAPAAAVIHIPAGGKTLERIEGEAVALTLGLTRGNQSAAARVLGISRPTLARKLRGSGNGESGIGNG